MMHAARDPILFISGAGLPPWIWDGVRQELGNSMELRVAARPAQNASGKALLVDYAEAALASAPAGRFTVIAHSSGGVIAHEVARIEPGRVSAVLAVSAVMPESGGSFLSALPAPNRWLLGLVMRLAGTRPPASVMRSELAHGLKESTVDRLIVDFVTESPGLYRDRTLPGAWSGKRGYLLTKRDRSLSLALQRRFAERLGATWREEFDAGHLPMVENPGVLARAIGRFLDSQP